MPDGGTGGQSPLDAGNEDAPSKPDADAANDDAGVSPVLVAITPTPLAAGDAPSPSEILQAELTTFGAGVRAAILVLPWDAVPTGEDPALIKKTSLYGAHGKRVVLNLAVVDRLVDHRPAALAAAAWDSPATLAAVESTIDSLFASSGAEVLFLTLGRDVDVYLAAHPDERAAFTTFAKNACAYAKDHAGASDDFGTGVAFSTAAPKNEPAFADLLDVEDVVAFSYFPGLGTFEPGAGAAVATVIAELADIGASKPVVLQATGLASDPAAGGDDESQRKFLATLLGAVGAQRKSFALVNVVELHDAQPAACSAWAEAQGDEIDGPLTAYACSLGLFRADGSPKPAWDAVLEATAALSVP